MTKSKQDILRHFRQYQVGVNEMLFFNTQTTTSDSPKFDVAMASLIREGLVVQERRRHAYSLTNSGFEASLRG
jgi:hypothetical protein